MMLLIRTVFEYGHIIGGRKMSVHIVCDGKSKDDLLLKARQRVRDIISGDLLADVMRNMADKLESSSITCSNAIEDIASYSNELAGSPFDLLVKKWTEVDDSDDRLCTVNDNSVEVVYFYAGNTKVITFSVVE